MQLIETVLNVERKVPLSPGLINTCFEVITSVVEAAKEERDDYLNVLAEKYPNAFADRVGTLKNFKFKMEFVQDPKNLVIKNNRFTYSKEKLDAVHRIINNWKKDGIIEPSRACHYNNIVIVKRGYSIDGVPQLRVCADFQLLNKFLKDPTNQAPQIESLREYFAGTNYFTRLDFHDAFMQIKLAKESRPFTTFGYKGQNYQFTRVAFGMSSSMQAFISAVSKLFEHLPFVVMYVDDIIICSKNIVEHRQHVEEVVKIIDESGMTLKKVKC